MCVKRRLGISSTWVVQYLTKKKPTTKPEIVNGEKWSPHVCCLQMSANENLMRRVQVSRPGAVRTSRLMDLDVKEVSI